MNSIDPGLAKKSRIKKLEPILHITGNIVRTCLGNIHLYRHIGCVAAGSDPMSFTETLFP